MTLEMYLAFVAMTVVLILIPGPNVALIVANSVAHGTRQGLVTVLGTSSAALVQLALVMFGLTRLVGVMADAFDWLRWAGVAYLLWLAYKSWTAVDDDLGAVKPQRQPAGRVIARGFMVSLTNPKTLAFYGAFFPQFITSTETAGRDLAILAVTFLVLGLMLDSVWALAAGRARRFLAAKARLRHRITAVALAGAGLGVALARRA
ncbi:LysE family translocator [Oryzibacter oryziterrae]|uniref:LysE family translocator n=1 Tax=Oryzibacter oryziterrae TaxID=2766474 RepID=UPI001F318DD0|nr:LysE family translocator [Oryzibacter oryziterrae]